MRIIAGKFRSTPLLTLEGDATRPSSDRLKEAMFSSLGGFVYGQSWLDVYGGSGAVGLEAYSRGAEYVVINDASKEAVNVILKNLEKCKITTGVDVKNLSAVDLYQEVQSSSLMFDCIFLDPPYTFDIIEDIQQIISSNLLKESGVIVAEASAKTRFPDEIMGFTKYKEKKYGIALLAYYRKKVNA